MTELEAKRQALAKLDERLAAGEIDEATYDRLVTKLTTGLTMEQRAQLGVTPAPIPQSPSRISFGPSGGQTRVPSLVELELTPGSILLGQWKIIRELGRGGFGAVFEAEDVRLGETYAVKVLDPGMVGREELLARFRREVAVTRKLNHRRVVRIFDYQEGLDEQIALLSMEYIRGTSVRDLLLLARQEGTPVPIELTLKIFEQTLDALGAAHDAGVIHRDVTPGNILLAGGTASELLWDPNSDPQVKLVDFGIAGLAQRSELSAKSRVLGTAAYVAPEVLDPDAEITPLVDMYGAGSVVYELLTGKVPMVTGHRPVEELRAGVPPKLATVVNKTTNADPALRLSAAGALDALSGKMREPGLSGPPPTLQKGTGETSRGIVPQPAEPGRHAREAQTSHEARASARPAAGGGARATRPQLRRGPVVSPMVVGIVLAAVLVTIGVIWLKSSRGWVFSPGRAPTPLATVTPSSGPNLAVGKSTATLFVQSDVPGDLVWLDGEALGPSPQNVEVRPGRHLVTVTRDRCDAEERWVAVGAEDHETVSFELFCPTEVPPTIAQRPTSKPSPSRTPPPAVTPVGDFFVQPLASSREATIEEARTKLTALGFPRSAQIVVSVRNSGSATLFKLRVGPFPDRPSADRVAQRLQVAGFPDSWVVAP